MPGRPTRHKIIEKLRLDEIEPIPPHEDYQKDILNKVIIRGLLDRLERSSPREALAAGEAIAQPELFHLFLNLQGMRQAVRSYRTFVGFSSLKTIRRWKETLQFNCLGLLIESNELFSQIPARADFEARSSCLRDLKLPNWFIRDHALEGQATLIEKILAYRHATNVGRMHKLLAQASRLAPKRTPRRKLTPK
jgi:hypothetical protein